MSITTSPTPQSNGFGSLWSTVTGQLQQFLADENLESQLSLAFGEGIDRQLAIDLIQNLVTGDVRPEIELRPAAEINGASGAFAAATGKVYLSEELVSSNDTSTVAFTLLEELGHYLDAQLNPADSPGDEGAIFANTVQGNSLDAPTLQALQSEDDRTTVNLDGEVVEIEQNAFAPAVENVFNTATAVAVSSSGRTYRGAVSSTDANDLYKFSLGSENNYSLSLTGLNATATATAELLDSDGNLLNQTSSQNPFQSISGNLSGGIYYLRVSSVNGLSTDYDLNLSVESTLPGITTTGSEVPIFFDDPIVAPNPGFNNSSIGISTAQSASLINLDTFRADPCFSGIDGSDFSVVVLDTGIDRDHPFFGSDSNNDGIADRIVHSFDFADNDTDASDFNNHGSNVSSIVASEDSTHTGMAPGANIIHLKVFPDVSGTGAPDSIEQALQWVVANASAYNVASVNMSLGDSRNYNTSQQLYGLDDEIRALAENNVIVVSAAGNEFFTAGSAPGVAYPAADPNSLSVGAVYDADIGSIQYQDNNGNLTARANSTAPDRIAPFSQRHNSLTTIFAPGAAITGANRNGDIVTLHGTSQAAPHIAGIAALAQQLAMQELGRRLTPTEFSNLLNTTGVTITDGDDENDNVNNTNLDFKRVDVHALGKAIGQMNNQAPVVTTSLRNTAVPLPATYPNARYTDAVFTDPDGDPMTYTATLDDGSPLPGWLIFSYDENQNPDAITFDVNPSHPSYPASLPHPGIVVRLTATDCWGASHSQEFHIFDFGSGRVIDGYIAGARVFFDANKNGVLDSNEPSTISDAQGGYQLDLDGFDTNNNGFLDPDEGAIVVQGGIDTHTGLPLTTPLTATPGSGVVTLLTTLVAELVERGLSLEDANTAVTNALSIPADVGINTFDPIAATQSGKPGGVETFTAMVQVQNAITQMVGLLKGASSASEADIVDSVVSAIATAIQLGTPLDLTDTAQLQAILESAADSLGVNMDGLSAQVAEVVAAANEKIEDAVATSTTADLAEALAKVQKVALGETTQDLEAVGAGNQSIDDVVAENTGTALDSQIAVAQVFSADPTDISLSNDTVPEDQPIGTEVGTFSTVDPDTGTMPTYSLVAGAGDTDNDKFEIVGNRLVTKESFDRETQDSYSIRVLTSDGDGGVYSEVFTLDVTPNLAEAPPQISIQTLVDADDAGDFNVLETGRGGDGVEFQLTLTNTGNTAVEIEAIANDTFELDSAVLETLIGQTIAAGDSITATFMTALPDLVRTQVGTSNGEILNGEQVLLNGEMSVTASNAAGSTTVTGTHEVLVDARDTIAGHLGNDTINGGGADDVLRGDLNIRGSQVDLGGDDIIYGGAGNDRIGGKGGNDQLFGDAGDDMIWGDDGDDILRGGLGNDTLTGDDFSGGQGSDTFILAEGEGLDIITDFELGIDAIALAGGLEFGQLTVTQSGDDALIAVVGGESLAIVQEIKAGDLMDVLI